MKILEEQIRTQTNELRELLPQYEWLVAGISERRHGNMRIAANGDPVDAIARTRFATELGIPGERVAAPVLVHGATVQHIGGENFEERVEADGLVTGEAEVFLSVTTADCLPIFFVDGRKKLVGLVHAGWRGLLRGVVGATVQLLEKTGSQARDIQVAVGPAIGLCHYEVGLPVARQFQEQLGEDVVARREGRLFLDLRKSVSRLLGRAGIAPTNIKHSPVCTHCEERYFSHRRDGKSGVEAMAAVIGIVE